MLDLESMGRLLLVMGIGVILVGGFLLLASRIPGLGSLPGDIRIEGRGFSCFIPLATSIILSLVLTIGLNLVIRLINR
jgi:hypothetical protein